MNLKILLGAISTLLGTVGLVFAAIFFITASGNNQDVKILITCWVLGILFLFYGINLIGITLRERS